MAGGEGVGAAAAAAAAAAEGSEAGKGGNYDGKCVFCRIARREEPGTALLSSEVGHRRPAGGAPGATAPVLCHGCRSPAGSCGALVGLCGGRLFVAGSYLRAEGWLPPCWCGDSPRVDRSAARHRGPRGGWCSEERARAEGAV